MGSRFRTACILFVTLAVSLVLAPAALGLLGPPSTTITLDPALPNGTPPWYVTAPEVKATADQNGVLHYWWAGDPETTVAVTSGTPVSLGFANEGVHVMYAYTVSAGGTETPPAERAVYLDMSGPTRPSGFSGSTGDAVSLSWQASTDAVSGVAGYYVYRGDVPDLWDPSDRIAFITDTQYTDDADPGDMWWYAVSARDVAGNESFITDSIRLGVAARTYGSNRYATSLAVSEANFAPSSVATVVVASGSDYPDALCASGIAGVVGSPVILVGSGPIDDDTADEIARLGATDALVIGGPRAVAPETVSSLESLLSGEVERLAGPNRYATAKRVANEIAQRTGAPARAYIVSGVNFADAVSVSPAAYAEMAPILYATPDTVPSETLAALTGTGIPATVIVGGPKAVTSSAEAVLPNPIREHSTDRYKTSRAFADWAQADGVLDGGALYVVTGENFPDGLSAGPAAGTDRGPVVLSAFYDADALGAWIEADPERFTSAHIIGGPLAISDAVREAVSQSLSVY